MTAMWQAFSKKQNQKSDIKAILNKSYLKSKIQTITIIIKDLEVMSISGKSFLKSAICVTVWTLSLSLILYWILTFEVKYVSFLHLFHSILEYEHKLLLIKIAVSSGKSNFLVSVFFSFFFTHKTCWLSLRFENLIIIFYHYKFYGQLQHRLV